jgi:competence protein ComGC
MSSEDQVRPYHAKDEARGQETADAVAAVLKHAAEREKRAHRTTPPKKQPKWMLPLGIQLAVLAVYLLISPPGWITLHPIQGPDPAVQEQGLRVAMYMQSQQIEAYRQANGRLPASLADLPGTPQSGVEYERQGTDEYRLRGQNGSAALIYDSAQPAKDFLGTAAAALLRTAGNSGTSGG